MLSEERKARLKDSVKNQHNGQYATKICYGCGVYESDPDGSIDRAIFVRECRNCIDWNEYEQD